MNSGLSWEDYVRQVSKNLCTTPKSALWVVTRFMYSVTVAWSYSSLWQDKYVGHQFCQNLLHWSVDHVGQNLSASKLATFVDNRENFVPIQRKKKTNLCYTCLFRKLLSLIWWSLFRSIWWAHPAWISALTLPPTALSRFLTFATFAAYRKTSQELRMLSSVTIDCQITKIVMDSGSQLSKLLSVSQRLQLGLLLEGVL